MEQTKSTPLEKHVVSFLLTLITGLLLSGLLAIFNMKEQLVRMEERDKTKENSIQTLQKSVDNIQVDMGLLKNRLTIIESNKTQK